MSSVATLPTRIALAKSQLRIRFLSAALFKSWILSMFDESVFAVLLILAALDSAMAPDDNPGAAPAPPGGAWSRVTLMMAVPAFALLRGACELRRKPRYIHAGVVPSASRRPVPPAICDPVTIDRLPGGPSVMRRPISRIPFRRVGSWLSLCLKHRRNEHRKSSCETRQFYDRTHRLLPATNNSLQNRQPVVSPF